MTHSPCCRQLYYQNVTLLGSQGVLDAAVRDICTLLQAPAWELGVTATSKGLVAGPVSLIMETGDVIDCMAPGGELYWILESTFHSDLATKPEFCR